ncbi:MAG TPA: sigma-70 family RNA polymerase sigma factor [Chloroflexota bacterium]|nr:sigma-70 family RNA polymerase sigma factor [Chloroflexota bacterium]
MCDQDLARALAGDLKGNFEQLVLAYQDRLYAFALRLVGNAHDAEEIAQDTFLRAYQALTTYPAERRRDLAPRPWLYRIALNVTRNRRRSGHAPATSLNADGPEDRQPIDCAESPDAWVERSELSVRLVATLALLPERYRIALLLRHVAGLGYGEMAAALNRPVGTVKSDVHRATSIVRQALGGELSEVGGSR